MSYDKKDELLTKWPEQEIIIGRGKQVNKNS